MGLDSTRKLGVDFTEILRLAQRRWKTIVSIFVVALIISALFTYTQHKKYQATARVFISTDVNNPAEMLYASMFSQQRVSSYADLATSSELMHRVAKKLNSSLTPTELAGKISATVPSNSVLISIQATDENPQVAQKVAQAEAQAFTSYISDLERPAGKSVSPVKATITDNAQPPGSPVSPRTGLNLAIAAAIGLILGCAVAVLRDLLDTSVKSADDVQKVVERPVMAHMPYDAAVPKQPLLTDTSANTMRSEAFRLLRTNLQFLDLDANPKSFVITSAVAEEGKTSTSVNLAIALAQAGRRVLLVDGDLRRPRVARMLGLESAVGLTTVLVGRSDLESSIQMHQESGVHFLSSGPIPPNPTEILQSRATRDLMHLLRDSYDAVIIDAPPLLPVADAAIMATDVDGAILVVRHGKTTRDQLEHATERLEQVGGRLFGAVVNMTPRRRTSNYAYGEEYVYATATAKPSKRERSKDTADRA